MKLKSIEIEGFKSFDDKTVIRFDDHITAIVGPNGCGKSNIVDAIRWVMGEQSAKHLRGKSMEDVIFSGSQNRNGNSMASVEFTFETAGVCPPQYANFKEVSIGRKLYRTGESDYFINKSPVRLKDVTDLFLGTGVGTKAYSIIEQGRVGQVITAKSEDRRSIIEEAAGISKFKQRKEAALRKMESTQQNLLRLNDIITELETQVRSLTRQANKAEKFKVMKDEMMSLDLRLASADYQRFTGAQKELLTKIKELDELQVSLNNKLLQDEMDTEAERMQLTEIEPLVNDLQQQVFEWENYFKLAQSRFQNTKDDLARCERDQTQNDRILAELKQNLQGSHNGLLQVNQRLLFADLDCEELMLVVTDLEGKLSQFQESSHTLFSLMEQSRESYNMASNRLSQLSARREHLVERYQELNRRKLEEEQSLLDLTAKYQHIEKAKKELSGDLSELKQLKLSLNERSGELLDQLLREEGSLKLEGEELSLIKEELLKRKSRLQSLEELQRNFEGYQQGTRHVLERKKTGEMNCILDSVADVIETESEYENAVSAVLGERMQYLVVKNQEDGLQCAEYLKSVQVGRSSFIPIEIAADDSLSLEVFDNTETSWSSLVLNGDHGLKGHLKDCVRFKSGYEKLSHFLFGDIVLVDHLRNALEVWNEYKTAVVTFDGELISEDGTLTGGTLESTSKALLEKRREIKELGYIITNLVHQVKAKEEQCFDLDKRVQNLKREIEDVKSSCHQEEVKLATQEKDMLHVGEELKKINEQRGLLSQNIFTMTGNAEDIEKQLSELDREQTEQKEILDRASENVAIKKSEEDLYRDQLASLQEQLTKEKIKLAQSKEQRAFLLQEVDRLIADEITIKADIFEEEEKNTLLVKRKIFLEDRILFQERNLKRLMTKRDELNVRYSEKRNQFEGIQSKLADKEYHLKDERKKCNQTKDELNQLTLQLTQIRSDLSRIQEKILERYQKVLSEVFQDHLPQDDFDTRFALERAEDLRLKLNNIGGVNLAAIDELDEVKERYDFLTTQRQDLEESLDALQKAIQKINKTTKARFQETFDLVNEKFTKLFPRLFKGGQAYLTLTDPENILETGVEIVAQPPGKKLQSISLLSGGEQALTAVSLLFAIFLIKPSPFCLLDEVDAPLDDANVDRYNDIVKDMSGRTQFVIITHNKRTMQITNHLYGVTMEEPGVSKLVSVQIE